MRQITFILLLLLLTADIRSQTGINSGLIACYPFTGNALDQSGNGHDGIIYGPVLTADRFGLNNMAYYFNGTQDYIDIGMFSGFTSSDKFSISVWIQPDMVKLQTILFLMPDNFSDRFNAMAYYSHNGVSSTIWDYGNCNAGGRLMQSGTVFSSAWQHFVFTISPAGGMKVYRNGILDLSKPTASYLVNRNRSLWIGGGSDAAGAPFYFRGKIDDLRLYDRELTPSEIQTLYGLELICAPTALYETSINSSGFQVRQEGKKVIVKVAEGMPESTFTLHAPDGRQICSKTNVRGGDRFEVALEQISNGLLVYSFKSLKGIIAGKITFLSSQL